MNLMQFVTIMCGRTTALSFIYTTPFFAYVTQQDMVKALTGVVSSCAVTLSMAISNRQ